MSDTVLKLIPIDRHYVPPQDRHQPALDLLRRLTKGWEPEVRVHQDVEYVDAGESLNAVICPRCGIRLPMDGLPENERYADWYSDIVQEEVEKGLGKVRVIMPCCQAVVPFADLNFDDGGFARFELVVSNPGINYPLPAEHQAQIEALLSCKVRQLWARY